MSYCYYFLLAFVVARALASPYGAPLAACSSMTPLHGFDPQTYVESPFIILPLMVCAILLCDYLIEIDNYNSLS
jgi:hypothetical protein